jgi:hypothetical protein
MYIMPGLCLFYNGENLSMEKLTFSQSYTAGQRENFDSNHILTNTIHEPPKERMPAYDCLRVILLPDTSPDLIFLSYVNI